MTAREALDAAHLARWNVRKMALQVPQEPVIDEFGVTTPEPLAVPDFYATVRTNPITRAPRRPRCRGQQVRARPKRGVLRSTRRPRRRKRSTLRDRRALRGGRETFVTMKLPTAIVFDGRDGTTDRTELYLAALNSHDGSSKFTFRHTGPHRVRQHPIRRPRTPRPAGESGTPEGRARPSWKPAMR